MAIETARQRSRRKFVFGVLEQASNILGAMTASVTVVGLVLPTFAVFTGGSKLTSAMLSQLATLVISFALLAAFAAVTLRGLARRLEDNEVAVADRREEQL